MDALKNNTLKVDNIAKTIDGYYRYVNHGDKLVTTGFTTKEMLLKYTKDIRFDDQTVKRMSIRYVDFYELGATVASCGG